MMSAGELALLRREVERTLSDLCVVRRYGAPTQDPATGETPGTVTTTQVACRVANGGLTDRESVVAQQLQVVIDWVVTLPHDTPLRQHDQIVWTDLDDDVHTLEVQSTGDRSTMIQRRVLCSEASSA